MISVLRKVLNSPKYEYYSVDDDGIYVEFICDDESDISNLPTTFSSTFGFKPRPGSVALICYTSALWLLKPSREWIELEAN